MDIIKILQREIHDCKVKWGELKEQNVALQGFKKMVMEKPVDYVDWKKKCQELENEMILIKGITVLNSPELRTAQKKIKELEDRLAEVLSLDDEHQKLNGELREDNKAFEISNKAYGKLLKDASDKNIRFYVNKMLRHVVEEYR